MTSNIFLVLILLISSVAFGTVKSLPDPSTTPGTEVANSVSTTTTDPKPLIDTNIKVKLNDSEVLEFEIKPQTITRDQFLRFRKYLTRMGIVLKNVDAEINDGSEDSTTKKKGIGGKDSIYHINNINEERKKKYPEKLSEVTAEDILPLLPQNLSSFLPYVYQLKNERCQRQAQYFLLGLHNLTQWAVESKFLLLIYTIYSDYNRFLIKIFFVEKFPNFNT